MRTATYKLMVAVGVCLLLASCAQTEPPLPPSLELPRPPSDLRASRKGSKVTLTWSEPTLTTDGQKVRYMDSTRICRSVEPEMTECGNPLTLVPPPPTSPPSTTPGSPKPQVYIDTLPPEMQLQDPAGDATDAVEALTRDGRGAGISNRVKVPLAPTLAPPTDFAAHLTGDGVVLTWTSASETSASPAIQYRYRIYRRDESTGRDAVAGEIPAATAGPMQFLDSSFEWEKTYLYRITAVTIVSRPPAGEVEIEGDDSAPVRVFAHDVFPPAVPSGLQAVYSGEGQERFVDLIWAPVTNPDLAGYNVYRREPGGTEQKLNSDVVKTPAYRDTAIASGKAYIYSVSAVDVRGNESARSQEASEQVP